MDHHMGGRTGWVALALGCGYVSAELTSRRQGAGGSVYCSLVYYAVLSIMKDDLGNVPFCVR